MHSSFAHRSPHSKSEQDIIINTYERGMENNKKLLWNLLKEDGRETQKQ